MDGGNVVGTPLLVRQQRCQQQGPKPDLHPTTSMAHTQMRTPSAGRRANRPHTATTYSNRTMFHEMEVPRLPPKVAPPCPQCPLCPPMPLPPGESLPSPPPFPPFPSDIASQTERFQFPAFFAISKPPLDPEKLSGGGGGGGGQMGTVCLSVWSSNDDQTSLMVMAVS